MNKKQIESLSYCGHDKDYSIAHGLYVRVRKASKVWIYRGTIQGKSRVKTIGKFPDITSEAAKQAALQYRQDFKVLDNDDTVKTFIKKYYDDCILGNKNKRGQPHKRPKQAKRYLDQIEVKFGTKRIDSISRRQLITYLEEYSKRGARTGDVMRNHLKAVFGFAVFHSMIKTNPMLEVDSRVTGYRAVSRDRVLSDKEIKLVFSCTHKNGGLLRFLLLTGIRIGEANHCYQDGDLFRIKAEHTKNGKPHWVYLTETAKAQFPLPHTCNENIQSWLRRWLEKEGYAQDQRFTPHDLRRTFATRLNNYQRNTDIADSVGAVPPYIVEKMLNHTLDGVMQVYNRAEYQEQRIEAHKLLEKILLKIAGSNDD
mgnify:CR=1 FL=1